MRVSQAAAAADVPTASLYEAIEHGRVRYVALKGGFKDVRTTPEWVREWASRESR